MKATKTSITKAEIRTWVVSCLKESESNKKLRFITNSSGRADPCLIDQKNNVLIIKPPPAFTFIFEHSKKIMMGKFDPLHRVFDDEVIHQVQRKFNLELKEVQSIYDWIAHQPEFAIDESEISSFCFKSEDKYTYFRFDYDLSDTPEETPAIDSLLSNFTNQEAIRLWIGSLCFEKSDRSQYLWLYGQGGNGKSLIGKMLLQAFGENNAKYMFVPEKAEERFFTSTLPGYRLVIMDDTNKHTWVKSGLFKGITGNDRVGVEKKFQEQMNAKLKCKFLFTSNKKPTISHEKSDLRRVIFSTSPVVFSVNPGFERQVKEESDDFILKCAQEYQAKMPNYDAIPVDMTETDDVVEAYFEEAAHACAERFAFDPMSIEKSADVTAVVLELVNLSRVSKQKIYDYLEFKGARHGDDLRKYENGTRYRYWVGIKILKSYEKMVRK